MKTNKCILLHLQQALEYYFHRQVAPATPVTFGSRFIALSTCKFHPTTGHGDIKGCRSIGLLFP